MDREIYARITSVLEDALSIDAEEIESSSNLRADFGAESLDQLDITFQLEREFKITIKEQNIFPSMWGGIIEGRYMSGERVSEAGIEQLRTDYHHIDWEDFSTDPRTERITSGEYDTPGNIERYLSERLGQEVLV